MTEKKPLKIEFAPGCFDNFEGTQEELDEMIKEVTDFFNNNSMDDIKALSVPIDDLNIDSLTPEEQKELLDFLGSIDGEEPRKDLH